MAFSTLYAAGDNGIMEHEMFHAFQDDFYGNTEQYGSNQAGYVNIEFEQILMNDISKGWGSAFGNGTSAQRSNYEAWLLSVTNDFSRHGVPEPGSARYNTFMSNYFYQLTEFNSIPGNVYSSTVLSSLKPAALYSVLQTNPDCL